MLEASREELAISLLSPFVHLSKQLFEIERSGLASIGLLGCDCNLPAQLLDIRVEGGSVISDFLNSAHGLRHRTIRTGRDLGLQDFQGPFRELGVHAQHFYAMGSILADARRLLDASRLINA